MDNINCVLVYRDQARNTGRAGRMHKVQGTEEYGANPSGPAGDWTTGCGRQGGSDVRVTEAGIGRKGPLDGRTPGTDRDLGTGRGRQREVNRTRDGSHRLAQGTPCGRPAR